MLVPSLGIDKIIAFLGLIYIIRNFRRSYKLNKLNFILQLTQLHRDIWNKINEIDGLDEKLTNNNIDLATVTQKERRKIVQLILHIKLTYEANRLGIYKSNNGIMLDVGMFMNYKLANQVWLEIKKLHEQDFVNFICMAKFIADPLNNSKPKNLFIRLIGKLTYPLKLMINPLKKLYIKKKGGKNRKKIKPSHNDSNNQE